MNELDLLVENYFTDSFEASDLFRLVEQVMDDDLPIFKKNEGDIAEGLFALALALYIADGTIDERKFNALRAKIDPADTFEELVAEKELGGDPDLFRVKLTLRLKSVKTTGMSFGQYLQDVPTINKKINTLVNQLPEKKAIKEIMAVRDEIINNTKKEVVEFHILADGVAGESSGGVIKSDVELTITVAEGSWKELKTAGLEPHYEVAWSIKSDAKTVANRGVLVGLSELADAWELPVFKSNVEQYWEEIKVSGLNREITARIFREFGDELMKIDMNQEFVERAYNFIEASTHGEDMVDIIDIGPSKIKEITKDRLQAIKNDDGILKVVEGTQDNGDPIFYFLNVPKGRDPHPGKDRVFQLRTKLRDPKQKKDGSWSKSEYKMMVELGSLVFALP